MFDSKVSPINPFLIDSGIFNTPSKFKHLNIQDKPFPNSIRIYGVKGIKGGAKRQTAYIERNSILKNSEWIDMYKLFMSKTYSTNAINPPKLIVGDYGDVCTETFLVFGPFESKTEQQNCLKYTETTLYKVLLLFGKGTIHVTQSVFQFVPLQDFTSQSDIDWSQSIADIDRQLYKKYNLTSDEIAFIEKMIRPME